MEGGDQNQEDFKEGSTGSEDADCFFEMDTPLAEPTSLVKNENKVGSSERTRRGSTCKQLRPLPTFVKTDAQNYENGALKMYFKKVYLLLIN